MSRPNAHERRWREEIDAYRPEATEDDWAKMEALLTAVPANPAPASPPQPKSGWINSGWVGTVIVAALVGYLIGNGMNGEVASNPVEVPLPAVEMPAKLEEPVHTVVAESPTSPELHPPVPLLPPVPITKVPVMEPVFPSPDGREVEGLKRHMVIPVSRLRASPFPTTENYYLRRLDSLRIDAPQEIPLTPNGHYPPVRKRY